jgi:hypothetical protein
VRRSSTRHRSDCGMHPQWRTRLHRSHHQGNIGISADEDDGDVDIRAGELGLKIEPAHASQPDVKHQTAPSVGQPACQKFADRAEQFGLQADVFEETVKRLSHRDIIVDDEDNRFLRPARKGRVFGDTVGCARVAPTL